MSIRHLIPLAVALAITSACSSGPPVKSQEYAALKTSKTFDSEFPVVWKAIEKALEKHKITDRDPEEVDAMELKKLSKRTLETDWIYGQSRDKYVEYKMNDLPQKKYLGLRHQFKITASRVMGGTDVKVETNEEIERLNADGSSQGYSSAEQIDTSRPNELLEKIQMALLQAHP